MRFHLADVFLPNATDLGAVFQETEEIEGTVVDFSDSGSRRNAFALIEIVQKRTLIIPIERLEPVSE